MAIEIIKKEKLDNQKVIIQTLYNSITHCNKQEVLFPILTLEELIERYNRIKPIVKINDLYYTLREFNIKELKNFPYMGNRYLDKEKVIKEANIKVLGEFTCYHKYNLIRRFKPTIEEVLSQFPDNVLNEANAFYLYDYPETIDDTGKIVPTIKCHKSKIKALIIK